MASFLNQVIPGLSQETSIDGRVAGIEFRGFEQMFKDLAKLVPNALEIATDVLNDAASDVYQESQTLVPVETGNLKASGEIMSARPLESGYGEITAKVMYGGDALAALTSADPEYAVTVHEDLSMPHDDGQAKYLETPFLRVQEEVKATLANRIKEAI